MKKFLARIVAAWRRQDAALEPPVWVTLPFAAEEAQVQLITALIAANREGCYDNAVLIHDLAWQVRYRFIPPGLALQQLSAIVEQKTP